MIHIDDDTIARFHELADGVLRSGFLSEGQCTRDFEGLWAERLGCGTAAVQSGGFALWALLEAADVRGKDVIVPTNTFMASALAVEKAGGRVVWADCSREDLCLTRATVEAAWTPDTAAVMVVHCGGHMAFDTEAIAALCDERGSKLIEDCAHAHGSSLNGRAAGTFGFGGAYSFYATKTLPIGEGGLVCSHSDDVLEFTRKFRNYGKFEYEVRGFHGRMSELQAALGVAQTEKLDRILAWKRALAARYDEIFDNRLRLPAGMESSWYKYIVFDTPLAEETGKVYGELCHALRGEGGDDRFPNSVWVAEHHACPPIWYGWPGADLDDAALRSRLLPS